MVASSRSPPGARSNASPRALSSGLSVNWWTPGPVPTKNAPCNTRLPAATGCCPHRPWATGSRRGPGAGRAAS
eukprot:11184601-Lingulodinium_polyedra.AAC.1